MAPLEAVVKNGRIVVDAPTDLPDGTELELVPFRSTTTSTRRRRPLLEAIEGSFEDFGRHDQSAGDEEQHQRSRTMHGGV